MCFQNRQQVVDAIRKTNAIVNSLQPEACEQPYGGMSMAAHCDGAVSAVDQIPQLNAAQGRLKQLQAVLEMFDKGTYGICQGCGERIPAKRLEVIPTASLCVDCKKKEEAPASRH